MGVWAAPGVSKDTKPLNTPLYGGRGELAHLVGIPSVLDTPLPFMKRGSTVAAAVTYSMKFLFNYGN